MKRSLTILLISLITLVLAQEYPYTPGVKIPIGLSAQRPNSIRSRSAPENYNIKKHNRPIWSNQDPTLGGRSLERMSLREKQNAEINIDLGASAIAQAIDMASQIENLWNSERFEEALARFPELEKLTNMEEIEIGIAWRTPVPTTAPPTDWAEDVRIGNRDSIYLVSLDIHRASGNLFAILLYPEGSGYYWSVNHSVDGGVTWNETYTWFASYPLSTASASVIGNHCHVAYHAGGNYTEARLRRFRTSDGTSENFNNDSSYIRVFTTTSPDSIKEVVITSNQDYLNNRLYYLAITTQGNLRFFWDDSGAVSWTEVPTNVNYANHGLDATCNQGSAEWYLWASYISNNDSLRIDANSNADIWTHIFSYPVGSNPIFTSIGAFHDTIITVFEYQGTLVDHCRYLTNYTGGSGNWLYGNVGNDTTGNSYCPDVASRYDGGQGIAYLNWQPQQGRYTWRDYYGTWSTPVTYTDYLQYEWAKPSLEYLDDGKYGTAYIGFDTVALSMTDQTWHNGPTTDFRFTRFDGKYFPKTKKVYFLGGRLSAGTTDGTVWCFVPDSGVYHNTGVTMPTPVSNYTICLLQDNYSSTDTWGLYIIGGRTSTGANTGAVQVYYPVSNTVRTVSTDPFPMRVGDSIPVPGACVVYNNKIYVFGGLSTAVSPYVTSQTWVYDPVASAGNRWSQITTANLSLARSYLSSAVVNGKIYAIGGDIYSASSLFAQKRCEVFDPSNPSAGWQTIADLPDSSGETRAFGFDATSPYQFADKIIIAGNGKWPNETNQCFSYDILTNTWSTFTNLLQARRNHAGVFIPGTADTNGIPGIWVFGGRAVNDTNVLRSCEYYPLEVSRRVVRGAFFDRSDWGVGVIEPTPLKTSIASFISLAPNPSRGLAKLSYSVRREGNVKISIYDATGRLVNRLFDENKAPGEYSININKQNLTPGIYFIHVKTPDAAIRKTMTVIK